MHVVGYLPCPASSNPTEYFARKESLNPSVDAFELHKTHRRTGFETQKFPNVRSGSMATECYASLSSFFSSLLLVFSWHLINFALLQIAPERSDYSTMHFRLQNLFRLRLRLRPLFPTGPFTISRPQDQKVSEFYRSSGTLDN